MNAPTPIKAAIDNQIGYAAEHKDTDRTRIKEVIKSIVPTSKPNSAKGSTLSSYNLAFRTGKHNGARWILNVYISSISEPLIEAFRARPELIHCPLIIRGWNETLATFDNYIIE